MAEIEKPDTPTNVVDDYITALKQEASKYKTFDEYEKAFSREYKRGIYYHLTDNPNFVVDLSKGATDAATGKMTPGSIMFTTDLDYWADTNWTDRPYVAILDLSDVDESQFTQVNRGQGNEFYLDDASNVKVKEVIPVDEALKQSELINQWGLDNLKNKEDLKKLIWNNRQDTPTNVVDDIKLTGTMGGNTTPTGTNIAYANVKDLEQFIQFDRKAEGNAEKINEIKKTISSKGYLYDTAYDSGVVFGVTIDELGNVQIAEGNHRLQALIDFARETGQEIYVPVNPVLASTGAGNKVQLTNTDNAYNSMKQLLTDMLEDNKNFDLDYIIKTKLGEPGRRISGLDSYTYPGGAPGTSTNQSNIKNFFNSIGLNTITYEELPNDNVYRTGIDTSIDTPKTVVDDIKPGGSLGAAKVNDPLVFDSWVDNYAKTTTSFIDNLPLSTTVKNQFDNLVRGRARNLATPGGVADAVDVWELGVLGLMVAAVAYKEYDEIPTILTNKAVDMFNSMTSSYGIPPVPKEQYDLDYEFINKVVETGEKFMPTDIIIKKVGEVIKGVGEKGLATGFGYVPTTPEKTDTMETKQKIQSGVQEEKMFERAKPKKVKPTGGAGAKIL